MPCLVCRCPCKQYKPLEKKYIENTRKKGNLTYSDEKFYVKMWKLKVCHNCFHDVCDHK